ncbi:hypothetical protein NBRC116599_29700 [Aquicoccus sp. SU-CL01552]
MAVRDDGARTEETRASASERADMDATLKATEFQLQWFYADRENGAIGNTAMDDIGSMEMTQTANKPSDLAPDADPA